MAKLTRVSTDLVEQDGLILRDLISKLSYYLNYHILFAEDFGVKVDSSDNEEALYNLGMYLSTKVTSPTRVVFPTGVSLVGSQKLAGSTGLGYAYQPSYFSRSYPSIEGRGYLFVSMTNADIVLDMSGWTLKLNSGLKIGSFDPVTGLPAPDQTTNTPNRDYTSDTGNMFIAYKSPNLKVLGGTLDGNLSGTSWGGKFGDDGYQNHAYNIWINQSGGVKFYGTKSYNSAVECLYIGEFASFNPDPYYPYPLTYFENCEFTDAGRNVVTVAGGANIEFSHCNILRGGSSATGIGNKASLPQSCVDIEAEAGRVYDVRFNDCYILDSSGYTIQCFPNVGRINKVTFTRCTLRGTIPDYVLWVYGTASNVTIEDSSIVGSIAAEASTGREGTIVRRCEINNNYGGVTSKNFKITGNFEHFDDNRIFIAIPSNPKVNYPIFSVGAPDVVQYGWGIRSSCRNNYIEITQGSSDDVTHVDLGGFSSYRDLSLFVNAAGMTGSKTLAISCLDSSIGTNGVATNSSRITFGETMSKRGDANVYYGNNRTMISGTISPAIDASQTIGRAGSGFKDAWIKDSIYMYNPSGQLCKISLSGTSLVVTPV